jgi:dihydrofolate reductase
MTGTGDQPAAAAGTEGAVGQVSIIAAMSENRVIGRDGRLPWHLPEDMRRFRRLTTGHTVIMGRRTYESLGAPLAGRSCVVITRDVDFRAPGALVVHSLEDALQCAAGDEETFIAGGSEVYRLALPRADRIYLTVVHAQLDGDTHFPEFDDEHWTIVEEEHLPADERHGYAMSFRIYQRATKRPSDQD